MIAAEMLRRLSTSGRDGDPMNDCRNAEYVSLMSRCDSAAIVPNTSDDLPEPETPVKTVSRRLGISTLTSFRLLTRAPWTRIMSWRSAGCWLEGGMAREHAIDIGPCRATREPRWPGR